ncbi:MAG: CRISPR-associated exonuclease Cas4 [Petroclostridium sp.]|jgi:CRISPR-associated exonuclease Cas4|nr:CRISPR-associated protein Cas4 [Clostridia bacterium]MDK2809548.1 CRISPR-associated exonuclease Cas4 [Petroclostridium sp.]
MIEQYYSEDNLLPLSGIQHFAFCKRQWALIHIERQWAENLRTVEGRHIHERVDNPFITETRGDLAIARSVPIVSYKLGLYGVADVVEFYRLGDQGKGARLKGKEGFWLPKPVEYKRGRSKTDERDEVQLCAQAMCIEEMLDVEVDSGDLFYGQTRHRVKVAFDDGLRKRVKELAQEMHYLFSEGITPSAAAGKNCSLCSLVEICVPKLTRKNQSVKNYIKRQITQ